MRLEPALLGTGPKNFTIDGVATVEHDTAEPSATFAPGPRHTPGIDDVWASLACDKAATPQRLTQPISGTFELAQNTSTAFTGHLKVDFGGPLPGPCGGDGARMEYLIIMLSATL